MFYSQSTGGFYDPAIHGDTIPDDASEISSQQHAELFEGQRKGKRIISDEKGSPVLSEPPLADLVKNKRREIESAREAAINEGFSHTFGDTADVVQTRQRDRENLTGLAVSAQRHPDKLFKFRAKSNSTYELTADDMLALADAAQDHVSQQYGKSWQLKADIDAALEAEDREALDAITW